MTRYLQSDANPAGHRLEDILSAIRADVIHRCDKLSSDHRPEAERVLGNNMKILNHLTEAVTLARDSTITLNRAFGPSKAEHGGPPRIGQP